MQNQLRNKRLVIKGGIMVEKILKEILKELAKMRKALEKIANK